MEDRYWPVEIEFDVKWGEMDAFNHVNNTVYFKYFEEARIQYFRSSGFRETTKPLGLGPILAQTGCQFILPVQYPDRVKVKAGVSRIGNKSISLDYELHSEKLGLVAKGDSIIVCYDYETAKTAPLPQSTRESISLFEKREFR